MFNNLRLCTIVLELNLVRTQLHMRFAVVYIGLISLHSASPVAVVADYSYVYTMAVDSDDIFLWYSQANNSLQLTEIYWRIKDIAGNYPNPFQIYTMLYYLNHRGDLTLECIDGESGDNIMSIQLFTQGLLNFPVQHTLLIRGIYIAGVYQLLLSWQKSFFE